MFERMFPEEEKPLHRGKFGAGAIGVLPNPTGKPLELARPRDLARWFDRAREGENLQLIWLFDGGNWVAGSTGELEDGVSERTEAQVRPLVDKVLREREELGRVLRVGGELRAVALIPFESTASTDGRSITIVVDQLIPPRSSRRCGNWTAPTSYGARSGYDWLRGWVGGSEVR